MTKFRITSDLHMELYNSMWKGGNYNNPDWVYDFSTKFVPHRGSDKDTYLIIAGDIHSKCRDASIANHFFGERFKHVFIVPGNHSYYGTHFNKKIENVGNVTCLENDTVVIDGVKISGCALWTNFNNCPLDYLNAQNFMNDYRWIKEKKASGIPLKAQTVANRSNNSRIWLSQQESPDIVITHHLPTYRCVHEQYKQEQSNFCYASHYDELIMDLSPKYWIFGHSHKAMDFMYENTRMINNSYGYEHEPKSHDPFLTITI